jgi:hypothetical protein
MKEKSENGKRMNVKKGRRMNKIYIEGQEINCTLMLGEGA